MNCLKRTAVGMTTLLALSFLAASCTRPTTTTEIFYPESSGYVVDSTGTLKDETKLSIEKDLTGFDGKAQISVVIVQTISPLDIESYSINLAEKFKPGYKGKDNGVILIIAKTERKVRIEVGRGLESVLTDGKTGQILDTCVVPSLKVNNYDDAAIKGIACIKKEIQ